MGRREVVGGLGVGGKGGWAEVAMLSERRDREKKGGDKGYDITDMAIF